MRRRACRKCGKEYQTDRPGTYLCPTCSEASRKAAPIRDRVCQECGVTFRGGPRAWYCPTCRTERRREADRRHKKNGATRPIGSTGRCERCGAEYTVNGSRQRYCKDCADIAVKEAIKPHKQKYNAANRERMAEYKRIMRQNRKICAVCGRVFDADTVTVTCSEACAKELQSLRQAEADYRRGERKMLPGVKYDSGLPKSGVVGVTARRNGKWQAAYKKKYLGVYDTIQQAAEAIEEYKGMISDADKDN